MAFAYPTLLDAEMAIPVVLGWVVKKKDTSGGMLAVYTLLGYGLSVAFPGMTVAQVRRVLARRGVRRLTMPQVVRMLRGPVGAFDWQALIAALLALLGGLIPKPAVPVGAKKK